MKGIENFRQKLFHSFTHFELELKIMISKIKHFLQDVYFDL